MTKNCVKRIEPQRHRQIIGWKIIIFSLLPLGGMKELVMPAPELEERRETRAIRAQVCGEAVNSISVMIRLSGL